jgi:hypothetical protein
MKKLSRYEKFLVQRALQVVPAVAQEVREQEIRISLSEGRHEARMVEAAGRAALARYPAPAPRVEPPAVILAEAPVAIQPPAQPDPLPVRAPVRVPRRSNRMPWPKDYFGVRAFEQSASAGRSL